MLDAQNYKIHLESLINNVVNERFEAKKQQLDQQNLSTADYAASMEKLEEQKKREKRLVDFRYDQEFFDDFYDAFADECLYFKKDLTYEEIDNMFEGMIVALYKAKLQILDSQSNPDTREQIARVEQVVHEGATRIIWTQAQERFSDELNVEMDKVFKPLLDSLEKKKIKLYIKHGSIAAEQEGLGMSNEHPPSAILNEVCDYVDDFMAWHSDDKTHQYYQLDYGFSVLRWNALSMQYVKNANDKDIDVYLPDGTIPTSSIFWNYELNALRKMQFESNQTLGAIHYHQLIATVKPVVDELIKKSTALSKELEDVRMKRDEIYALPSPLLDMSVLTTLEQRNTVLKEEIEKLDNEKYELCAKKENWETIPFEQVKLKGLTVRNKPMTIGDMIKVGELLKKRVKEHKALKPNSEKRKSLTPMKSIDLQQKVESRVTAKKESEIDTKVEPGSDTPNKGKRPF